MSWRLYSVGRLFTGDYEFWYSDDQGVTWVQVNTAALGTSPNFQGLAVPKNAHKAYLYAETDAASTWPNAEGVFAIDLDTGVWAFEDDHAAWPPGIYTSPPSDIQVWSSANDDLVVAITGDYSDRLRCRPGPPGTPWVEEFYSGWDYAFWDVHGTPDGSAVYAIALCDVDWTNVLFRRDPTTGTWVEIYRTAAGFIGQGWQCVRAVSWTEAYIVGSDEFCLEGPAPASPPAVTNMSDRIWKWDGATVSCVWQPISRDGMYGDQKYQDLWIAEDGSEGWAITFHDIWHAHFATWAVGIEWVHYDGTAWTSYEVGEFPASTKIAQIPGDVASAITIFMQGGQINRLTPGVGWENDGISNIDYSNRIKPKIGGYGTGWTDGYLDWPFDFSYFEYSPTWGIQELEDVLWDLLTLRHLSSATGKQLDGLGEIVGEPRGSTDDEVYRDGLYLKLLINTSEGTPERIIEIVDRVAGGSFVQYSDRPPACAHVYVHEISKFDWLFRIHRAVIGGVRFVLSASEQSDPFVFGRDRDSAGIASGAELNYGLGWGESGVGNENVGGFFTEIFRQD